MILAVDEQTDPRLLPGDNQPPLQEVLAEEVAADLKRMEELVTAANNAVVKDAETQKQVTTLAGMLRTHGTEVEAKRKARKKPFDDGAQAVQDAFMPILTPIKNAIERLRALNDDYETAQERAREAVRRRLAEEEEAKRKAAEEAARKVEEAKTQGTSSLAAELAEIQARDAADAAARARENVRAAPVRTDVGSAHLATQRTYEIDDLTACLGYLRKTQRASLVEVIQPLVNRLGRAKMKIPGVRVVETKGTRFRT